jgi:hypothetical protein
MVRTAVLFLSLALAGGAPLAGLLDLLSVVWAADQADAGNQLDPNGSTTDTGNHLDPDGSTTDAGGNLDPDG